MLIMSLKRPPLPREAASEIARSRALGFLSAVGGPVLNKVLLNSLELCFKLRHLLAQSGLRPLDLSMKEITLIIAELGR